MRTASFIVKMTFVTAITLFAITALLFYAFIAYTMYINAKPHHFLENEQKTTITNSAVHQQY